MSWKRLAPGILALVTIAACDRGGSHGTTATEGEAKSGAVLGAPKTIAGKAKLTIGQRVTVCFRPQATNPLAVNHADFECSASLEAVKSPLGAGVHGKQVYDSIRALARPTGKLWAKSVDPGEDPKSAGGAIDLADADDEWFDNYAFVDDTGKAWMFVEIAK